MLHYLDDLDSKMEAMRAQFEREAELPGVWTSYNPSLGRPLLNSRKFLEPKMQRESVQDPETHAAAAATGSESPEFAAEKSNGFEEVSSPATLPMQMSVAAGAEPEPPVSPMEALQQKFAAHKVTAIDRKPS